MAVAAAAMLLAACQPPPPPPPPERIQLQFELYAEQQLIVLAFDVRWNRREFQIRAIDGYEFCDPRVESVELDATPVREPFAPGQPGFDGIIADGWVYNRGRATLSVVNNQACWDEGLWARYGGHPYFAGWNVNFDVRRQLGGPFENVSDFAEISRGEYAIVK